MRNMYYRIEQLLKGQFFTAEELLKSEKYMSLAVEEARQATTCNLVHF